MSWGRFLAWVVSHLDELPQVLSAAQSFMDAANLRDKAEALKGLIDVLVPILEDYPTSLSLSDGEIEGFMQTAHAQAIDLGKLWQLYLLLKPLIPILLDLLRND